MKQLSLFLGGAVLILAVFLFVTQKDHVDANTTIVEIETEVLPILAEHKHGDGDSPGDEGHHEHMQSPVYTVPEDMWVTKIDFEMINAPALTLHHMGLTEMNKPNLSCPNRMGHELVMSGQDSMYNPHLVLPEGYALFVKKDTPLILNVAIHNPDPPIGPGGVYKDVSMRLTLHTIPASTGATFTPVEVHNLYIDDTGCRYQIPSSEFTVPPNSTNYRVTEKVKEPYNPAETVITATSTIIYVGGHIHGWQHAKKLDVLKNGEAFFEFTTDRVPGDPYLFGTPHFPVQKEVYPGDVLSVEAVYDNPSSVPTRGAMGFFAMYITTEQ